MATQQSSLSRAVTRIINRATHWTHQSKRNQRQIAALQNNAIDATAAFTEQGLKGTANHLISGSAVWDTGLTFRVTQCVYIIENITYISAPQSVTLSAAHATLDRIDVISVNTDGVVEVVEGTAGATPVKPEYDAEDSVEVTFATISATATEPDNVSDTVIYDEDDDWTTAVSGSVTSGNTANPHAGTKHIRFDSATTGDYITLTDSADHSPGDIDLFKMYVSDGATGKYSRKDRIRFALHKGTTRVSSWVSLADGRNGYIFGQPGYQLISIPMSDFNSDGSAFDVLKIEAVGTIGMDIDDIDFQSGVTTTDLKNFAELDTTNVFTKAQATRVITLTDAATITVDLSLANMFEVVLDGNRTIDFINPTAGQHFTMKVQQDDTTGSRTLTWDASNDWAGATAPTLSTGVDDVDILSFVIDSALNIHGSLGIADSS